MSWHSMIASDRPKQITSHEDYRLRLLCWLRKCLQGVQTYLFSFTVTLTFEWIYSMCFHMHNLICVFVMSHFKGNEIQWDSCFFISTNCSHTNPNQALHVLNGSSGTPIDRKPHTAGMIVPKLRFKWGSFCFHCDTKVSTWPVPNSLETDLLLLKCL